MIAERRESYLDEGWSDAVIVPAGEYFSRYEYVKASKRKGGRVYIDVCDNGEVRIHEGYVTSKEAKRPERREAIETCPKVPRPEVSSTIQIYHALTPHAAARDDPAPPPPTAPRPLGAHHT